MWVPHLQIQPTVDQKYLENKNSRKFQKTKWNLLHAGTLYISFTLYLQRFIWHLLCIRYYKYSRNDLNYMGGYWGLTVLIETINSYGIVSCIFIWLGDNAYLCFNCSWVLVCVISSVLPRHSKDLKQWTGVTVTWQLSFIWQGKENTSSRCEGRLNQKAQKEEKPPAQFWLLFLYVFFSSPWAWPM